MSNCTLWDITPQAPYGHKCLSCGIVLVNVSYRTWYCHMEFDTLICSPVRLGFIFLSHIVIREANEGYSINFLVLIATGLFAEESTR